MRPVRSVRSPARLLSAVPLLMMLAACTSFDEVHYTPVRKESFGARDKPAQETQAEDLALLRQGFVRIGTLSVQREGIVDTNAQCLAQAAGRGADRVRLTESRKADVKTKVSSSCAETVTSYTTQYVCPSTGGASCYSQQVSQDRCVRWTTTKEGEVRVTRSAGILFRLDPALAEKELRAWELPLAIRKGDVAQVRALLRQGQNANWRMADGVLPIQAAIGAGSPEVLEELLNNGAQLEGLVESGKETPLMHAVRAGTPATVKVLVARGAKVDAYPPNSDWNALRYAVRKPSPDMIATLLEGGMALDGHYGKLKWTPLLEATAAENLGIMRLLIEKGANVSPPSDRNFQPLHEASARGNVAATELLLGQGANPNVRTSNGWTPLMTAAKGGNVDVIRMLLRRGVDVNAVNTDAPGSPTCCSALAIARSSGKSAAMEVLRTAGAK